MLTQKYLVMVVEVVMVVVGIVTATWVAMVGWPSGEVSFLV